MDRILQLKEQHLAELAKWEKRIEGAEVEYLNAEHSALGSALKGYEGVLSVKDTRRNRQARQTAKADEYVFSLSSGTSDVSLQFQMPDGDFDASGAPSRKSFSQKGYAQKGQMYGQKGYPQKGRR